MCRPDVQRIGTGRDHNIRLECRRNPLAFVVQTAHEGRHIAYARSPIAPIRKRPEPCVMNAFDAFVEASPAIELGLTSANMRSVGSDNIDLMASLYPFPRKVIRPVLHAVPGRAR